MAELFMKTSEKNYPRTHYICKTEKPVEKVYESGLNREDRKSTCLNSSHKH